MGIFYLQGIYPVRNLFNGKVFFSACIPFNIEYDMGRTQLMHVVVKNSLVKKFNIVITGGHSFLHTINMRSFHILI